MNTEAINSLLASGEAQALEKLAGEVEGFPEGFAVSSNTPWLILAIDVGNLATVKWMLSRGADPKLGILAGYSALHSAIDSKRPERYLIIDALIKAGADIEVLEHNNWTPLQLAAARNDVSAVKLLLEGGAQFNVRAGFDNLTAEEEANDSGSYEAAEFIKAWISRPR